jgi:chemotaxis protein methyltransferase CheR
VFDEELIPLPQDVFRLIRDYIGSYCGIYFEDASRSVVERRLNRRLSVNHLRDFREYYRLLLYDKKRDDELQEIIDILTVNETYFFRGESQLAAFKDEILPELKKKNRGKKRLNIWSAPCSTGEEPYTLAMLILEDGGFNDWDINIIGSDISQRVLKAARDGVFKKTSFRSTDPYFIKKYFKEEADGGFRISSGVKSLVNFNLLNMVDSYKTRLVMPMDIIFCRNLLIYFYHSAREKVADNLFDALQEGGYLVLGHSESMMNITTRFKLLHLKKDIVYQKPMRLKKR